MSVFTLSHTELTNTQLELSFPNLQIVRLEHSCRQCIACNYEKLPKSNYLIISKQITECMRQIRVFFERFLHLTALVTNYGDKYYTSEFRPNQLFTKKTLNSGAVEIQIKKFKIKKLFKLFNTYSDYTFSYSYLHENLFFLNQKIV